MGIEPTSLAWKAKVMAIIRRTREDVVSDVGFEPTFFLVPNQVPLTRLGESELSLLKQNQHHKVKLNCDAMNKTGCTLFRQ